MRVWLAMATSSSPAGAVIVFAKKPRPPPPRRPVQHPRMRKEPKKPKDIRRWLTVFAAVLALGGLVTGLAVALAGRGESLAEKLAGAGCTVSDPALQGARHVPELKPDFEYSSLPPTSGPHRPEPAIWNPYDRPVSTINAVHNLEHSGVVVQYGRGTPPTDAQRIIEWYRDEPNGIIVAPLPALGKNIALTAWGHLATCSRFDAGGFSAFRDSYRGKGPEPFPPELLKPGT